MTSKLNTLVHAACICLLLVLVPGPASPQDQKEAPPQQPEKAVAEPAQQSGKAASEPTQSAGSLISPAEQAAPQEAAPAKAEAPAPASPETAAAPPAGEGGGEYTIKQGDTLWDISNTFFKDPFLWPFIWKANPSITNPDLIYAGGTLMIPNLAPVERAMQEPAKEEKAQPAPVEKAVQEAAPVEPKPSSEGIAAAHVTRPKQVQQAPAEETAPAGRLIAPEEQILPIIDKYSMLSAGFVNMEQFNGTVVGCAVTDKSIFAYDDTVYVKIQPRENIKAGDKYLIFTTLGKVKHPVTGKRYGRLIRGLGVLEITDNDPTVDVLTARITLSFDAIEVGAQLAPYQEPSLIYPSSQKAAKDISGYILEVVDARTINADLDVVYLDKGSQDGVDRGDKFVVFAEPDKRGFPRRKIGEVQVFLVREHTSTAVVSKSLHTLTTGDAFDFKK